MFTAPGRLGTAFKPFSSPIVENESTVSEIADVKIRFGSKVFVIFITVDYGVSDIPLVLY